MGSFYVNYTVRGPSQQAVAKALSGRAAIVTPQQDGSVVDRGWFSQGLYGSGCPRTSKRVRGHAHLAMKCAAEICNAAASFALHKRIYLYSPTVVLNVVSDAPDWMRK